MHEARARLRHFRIREKLSARGGEPGEALGLPADLATAHAIERISLARQADRGRDQLAPRQVPELAVRLVQSGHAARHADGAVTREGRFQDVSRRIDVHVAPGGGRRRLAEVEGVHRAVVVSDDHEAAAPDVARDRVHHGEGERDRHGSVDCVAAAAQNVHADVARERMRGDHHGMRTSDGLDAQAEGPVGGDQRVTARHHAPRRLRGRVDSGGRDGRRDEGGDVGRDGDGLRQLDAATARRQQQQRETEVFAHAELCTLTRVRVNV